MRGGVALSGLALALLAAGLGSACRSVADETPHVAVDPFLTTHARQQPVRVLVELRIAGGVTPEGQLTATAVEAQRLAIATARISVLAGLAGTKFLLVREYATTPHLALEVGADALAALEAMGDHVRRVTADEVSAPTR